jgi:hypothetical protein
MNGAVYGICTSPFTLKPLSEDGADVQVYRDEEPIFTIRESQLDELPERLQLRENAWMDRSDLAAITKAYRDDHKLTNFRGVQMREWQRKSLRNRESQLLSWSLSSPAERLQVLKSLACEIDPGLADAYELEYAARVALGNPPPPQPPPKLNGSSRRRRR